MNPPYGRGIGDWMRKARESAHQNDDTTVVVLVHARTDTRWWHENIPHASAVIFIKGRLKFGDSNNSAPFPSVFVVFGSVTSEQIECLAAYGWGWWSAQQSV